MSDEIFVDTNVLVYAFDNSQNGRKKTAEKIIDSMLNGKGKYYLSNQVLGEFATVLLSKSTSIESLKKILSGLRICGCGELIYNSQTVCSAVELTKIHKLHFWDALIASTMLENSIHTIYTEDKNFEKISEIEVINPFTRFKD